jgi:hypothetical protein
MRVSLTDAKKSMLLEFEVGFYSVTAHFSHTHRIISPTFLKCFTQLHKLYNSKYVNN